MNFQYESNSTDQNYDIWFPLATYASDDKTNEQCKIYVQYLEEPDS